MQTVMSEHGRKKLGDIKTQNLYTKLKLIVLRVQLYPFRWGFIDNYDTQRLLTGLTNLLTSPINWLSVKRDHSTSPIFWLLAVNELMYEGKLFHKRIVLGKKECILLLIPENSLKYVLPSLPRLVRRVVVSKCSVGIRKTPKRPF